MKMRMLAAMRWMPLLLLPIAVTLAVPHWLYTYPGYIDPWIYWGITDNLDIARGQFSTTYYVTRWAWILPGHLASGLFGPLDGKYAWHGGFLLLAVSSTYAVLRLLALPYRIALLGATLLACDRFFLFALGWDYVDGGFATYLMLTLAGLTLGATASGRRAARAGWMLGGAAFACTVNLLSLLVVLAPALAIYGLVILALRGQASMRHVAASVAWTALGAVFATLGLMAVAWGVTGSADLWSANLAVARMVLETEPWAPPPLLDRLWPLVTVTPHWLHLPFIVAGLAIVNVAQAACCRLALRHAIVIYYLASFTTELLLEAAGRSGITFFYVYTLVYPAMYATLAVVLYDAVAPLSRRAQRAVLVAVATLVVLAALYSTPNPLGQAITPLLAAISPGFVLVYAGAVLAWLLLAPFTARGQGLQHAAAILLVVIVSGVYLSRAMYTATIQFPDRRGSAVVYRTIVTASRIVKAEMSDVLPRFIYRGGGESGDVAIAVNAAWMWGYTALDNSDAPLNCADLSSSIHRVIVMGGDETVLTDAVADLAACGATVTEQRAYDLSTPTLPFRLIALDVQPR